MSAFFSCAPAHVVGMSLVCAAPGGSLVSTSGDNTSLVVHTLREVGNVWRFEPSPGPPLAPAGSKRHVIACRTVLDMSQGVRVPCIATRGCEDSTEVEILAFSCLQDCSELTSHGVVRVSATDNELHLLSGPVVVWGEEDAVYLGLRGEEHSRPTSFTHHGIILKKFTSSTTSLVVDKLWSFDCPDGTVMLFVRLILSPTSQDTKGGRDWLCLSLVVNGNGGEVDVKALPSDHYIPSDYGYIATCIALYCGWGVGREGGVASTRGLLVGTRYQQVVLLRGGIPLHCVAMETIPSDIIVLEIPGNDVMAFAVRTADKGLRAYRVPGEGEPEEVGRWGGVDRVLVGDFADLFRDQLLVLFSENLEDFLITDLNHVTVGSQGRVEDQRPSLPKSDSLVSAVKALQVRQRVGEAHLMDVERELQQKTELLRESLQLLQSLGGGAGPVNHTLSPARDQSLVCVVPGMVESAKMSGGVSDSTHNDPVDPVVTECWQRLLNGCWTVGVVLKNTSNSCVWRGLSLALVVDDVVVTEAGGSCVVWVHSSEGGGEDSCKQPPAKCLKTDGGESVGFGVESETSLLKRHSVPPGGQACLVAWTTLPTTPDVLGVLSGGLVFSWRERGCEGVRVVEVGRMELPGRCLTDPSLRCDWLCLQHWNGEGDLFRQWRDFRRKENQDLACLLASHHVTHLTLSSHYTDLTSLASLLRQRLPLPSHCVHTASPHAIPHGTGTSATLLGTETEHLALKGVHLYVSACKKSATISVLHRESVSLSMMMSALRGCLSDDVTLSTPHSSHTHSHTSPSHHHPSHITGQQTQLVQLCVMALRREVERRKGAVGREVERRKDAVKREGRGEEGEEAGAKERVDSELLDTVEETDLAMFRAMSSFNM